MKFLGNMAGVLVTLGAIGLFAFVLVLWRINSGLPNYEHLANYTPPVMSRAHAGNGSLIAEYAQERRIFVPIDTAPKHLIDAFLAAEDKNFYEHVGIDFMGIVRSSRNASTASFNLRSSVTSLLSRKFFATCWVMVDAPSSRLPLTTLTTLANTARTMPIKSMPTCS